MTSETEATIENFKFSFDNILSDDTAEKKMAEIMKDLGINLSGSKGFKGFSDMGSVSHKCPA